MTSIKVEGMSDLQPGENRTVQVNGLSIAFFNVNGELFAIGNSCAHRGGSLGDGFLEGDIVTCPLHGWQYDVKTGSCVMVPSASVPCFPVKKEGNDIFIEV